MAIREDLGGLEVYAAGKGASGGAIQYCKNRMVRLERLTSCKGLVWSGSVSIRTAQISRRRHIYKKFIYKLVEVYVNAITSRLNNESNDSNISSGRADFMIMIMKGVVRQLVEWLNERMIIDTVPRNDVTKAQF